MARSKQADPIPEDFGSLAAAADFWDTHDLADYVDQTREVDADVDIQRRADPLRVRVRPCRTGPKCPAGASVTRVRPASVCKRRWSSLAQPVPRVALDQVGDALEEAGEEVRVVADQEAQERHEPGEAQILLRARGVERLFEEDQNAGQEDQEDEEAPDDR
jgi:hypothetical protein